MKKRRIAVIALAVLMIVTGCAREDTPQETEAVKGEKITGVFRKSELILPDGYMPALDSSLSYQGDEFYFTAMYNYRFSDISVFSADRDGMVREVGAGSTSDTEPVQDGCFVQDEWDSPDGGVVFAEVQWNEEGYTKAVYLSSRSKDGSVQYSIELPSYFGYSYRPDEMYSELMGFYIYDCLFFENCMLVLTTQGLCALSENGSKLWENSSQREHHGIMESELGVLYLSDSGGLRIVNTADGSLSEEIAMPEELTRGSQYQQFIEVISGDGHDIYIKNTEGLYGVDFVMDENGNITGEGTEVINWINSDIVYTSIIDLCVGDENTVMLIMRDPFAKASFNYIPYIAERVSEDEIAEKEIISLVQVGYNYYLNTAVALFNEKSETHRVVITDYTMYDDEDMRKQKLNAEMAAGRVPDIIFYDSFNSRDTTLTTYIESGLFTDLIPLMQADETFDYNDLLGYVKKPYIESDGKQYLFPLAPASSLYYVSPEYIDGIMTVDEMFEKIDGLDEGKALTSRDSSMLRSVMYNEINRRIDYENYTCSFDDGEFSVLIERIKRAEDEAVSLRDYQYRLDYIGGYLKGEYYLYSETLSEFNRFAEKKYYFGDDFILTGIPNDDGKLISSENGGRFLAITEASECKEEAFELLETIMIVKRDIGEGGFFFNADVDREYESIRDKTYTFEDHTISYVSDGNIEEGASNIYKFTKDDAELIKSTLNSIDGCIRGDTEAFNIAYEEIFGGDPARSGEEIASVVQSRVSLYLSEVSK